MSRRKTNLAAFGAALLVASLGAQREIDLRRDVSYAEGGGQPSPSRSLDVQAPPGARDAPVIVFVHGGGWRGGDKANVGATGEKRDFFVARGFVYVSVNYRLAPEARHPAQVEDVAAALAWVREHIAEHGGDPERVVLIGHSAGAHLAALVATDARRLGALGIEPIWLRGVVLLDGAAYDLRTAIDALPAGSRRSRMFEAAFGPPGDGWLDASPVEHVEPGRGYPPFLVVHAGRRRESAEDAATLAEALRSADGTVEVFWAEAKDHGGVNRDLGLQADPLTAAVAAFVDRCVAPAPDFAAVDALLAGLVADGVVPGISLMVVGRDGAALHETTFGTGDLDAVLPIASATKIAGATVTMALVDRGLLALDERVTERLADFPVPELTVAQCLSCTSGLGSRGMLRVRRAATLADATAAVASAARLGTLPAPGAEFRYGGAGFQVAGRVAEVAGEKPFAALFEELVAAPLGLTTWAWRPGDANPDLGGGGRCSARDYAKLVAMHLGDGVLGDVRVLSEEAARAMRADRRGGVEIAYTPYEDAVGYGLGWWILPPDRDGEAPHVFADPGAFGATPWIDVERGYGAVLFLHGADGDRPPRGGFRSVKRFFADVIAAVAAAFDSAAVR